MLNIDWPKMNKRAMSRTLRGWISPSERAADENAKRIRPYRLSHLRPSHNYVYTPNEVRPVDRDWSEVRRLDDSRSRRASRKARDQRRRDNRNKRGQSNG